LALNAVLPCSLILAALANFCSFVSGGGGGGDLTAGGFFDVLGAGLGESTFIASGDLLPLMRTLLASEFDGKLD
jgi:hypothetical protein